MDFRMNLNLRIFLLVICIQKTFQHGYLADPPQRSSIWRENPNAPVNYNDNQLFCGGRENLRRHRGMCGTCGDPYQGPRENEAGGKYALGIITRSYPANQRRLPVKVVLTAYHKGYYEFKICPHNNPNMPVSQRCLNRYPLRIVEGSRRYRTRYYPKRNGVHRMTLMLPRGLRCSQCVLQWRYRTGNSWGVDKNNRRGCIGCGLQEEFWNCADIKIGYNFMDWNFHFKTNLEESSDESDSSSDESVKDSGINIINHFFSPFSPTNTDSFVTTNNDRLFQDNTAWSNNLVRDQSHLNEHRTASDIILQNRNPWDRNVLTNHAVFNTNNDKSTVRNSFELTNPRTLQNTVNRNHVTSSKISNSANEIQQKTQSSKLNTQFQHSLDLPWINLINGNHGNIQTSFIPQEEWSLLHMFDK